MKSKALRDRGLGWLFLERVSTKDRTKLQDNHNLFNESLRENADL